MPPVNLRVFRSLASSALPLSRHCRTLLADLDNATAASSPLSSTRQNSPPPLPSRPSTAQATTTPASPSSGEASQVACATCCAASQSASRERTRRLQMRQIRSCSSRCVPPRAARCSEAAVHAFCTAGPRHRGLLLHPGLVRLHHCASHLGALISRSPSPLPAYSRSSLGHRARRSISHDRSSAIPSPAVVHTVCNFSFRRLSYDPLLAFRRFAR